MLPVTKSTAAFLWSVYKRLGGGLRCWLAIRMSWWTSPRLPQAARARQPADCQAYAQHEAVSWVTGHPSGDFRDAT
jgi:hypothetical protein